MRCTAALGIWDSTTSGACPRPNILAKPKPTPSCAYDWLRKVGVPTAIDAYAIRIAEAKEAGDFLGVDEVANFNLTSHGVEPS
jgi:hypothetical protein